MVTESVLLYTGRSLGVAVHSEEEKVFFTTYDGRAVEVVKADGSDRTNLFNGTEYLLGMTLDTKKR